MRHLNVSLATVALVVGCLCTPAFAQQQDSGGVSEHALEKRNMPGEGPWGVSEHALEKRDMPGVGFLDPARYVMCQAIVSPVDGTFAPVLAEQGESLGFVIDNDSEVPVSVVLETRDEHGKLQGALFTRLGASTVRRLGLSVWPEAASSATLSTVVRVMPLRAAQEISVVVGQQKVSGTRPELSGQILACSAQECALRSEEPGGQEPNSKPTTGPHGPHHPGAGQPETPPESSTGPHGPHLPGAEMPGGLPDAGIGPHGPHNSNEPGTPQTDVGEETGGQEPEVGEETDGQAPEAGEESTSSESGKDESAE